MLMRTIFALVTILALGTSNGWADAYKSRRHHHRAYIVQDDPDIAAWGPNGGRLVLHSEVAKGTTAELYLPGYRVGVSEAPATA